MIFVYGIVTYLFIGYVTSILDSTLWKRNVFYSRFNDNGMTVCFWPLTVLYLLTLFIGWLFGFLDNLIDMVSDKLAGK